MLEIKALFLGAERAVSSQKKIGKYTDFRPVMNRSTATYVRRRTVVSKTSRPKRHDAWGKTNRAPNATTPATMLEARGRLTADQTSRKEITVPCTHHAQSGTSHRVSTAE